MVAGFRVEAWLLGREGWWQGLGLVLVAWQEVMVAGFRVEGWLPGRK
jgi:hypothetical protein